MRRTEAILVLGGVLAGCAPDLRDQLVRDDGDGMGLDNLATAGTLDTGADLTVEQEVVVDTGFDDVTASPETGWTTDLADANGDGEPELAFGSWYDCDSSTHVLTPKPGTFVVASAGDQTHAVELVSYYDDTTGDSGTITFRCKPVLDRRNFDAVVDAADAEAPVYLTLHRLQEVATPADPTTDLGWDLSLARTTLRVNGGVSGSGAGMVYTFEHGTPWEDVTLGSSATETVMALGKADALVAADASSKGIPGAAAKATLGYYRAIGAEGVLSTGPDLVVGTEAAGPPAALDQIRAAGVPMALLTDAPTLEAATRRITQIGALLDTGAEAVLTADPDVLLLTTHGLGAMGGEGAVWATPGLAQLDRSKVRLVVMDDNLLLGFGPRTGQAALELAQHLHGGASAGGSTTP